MRNILMVLMFLAACTSKPQEVQLHWFKGNTHTHTVLCGHADTHPDTVAMWYLDRGYNFLILSEHNQFIDPDSVNLPADRREDFILIPGEEVSDHEHIHTTAMNISRVVPAQRPAPLSDITNNPFENFKVYLMQKHADSIRSAGGIPILNHPNWLTGASAREIQQVDRLHMIELHNGHPDVANWGNEKHASMEVKWDSLLTAGRKIYGVSSDDAHYFHDWGVDVSNPGRGWVMVRSQELTPDAIASAMSQGEFYATSGVILSGIDISKDRYHVQVDTARTYKEIASPYVVGYKSGEVKQGFWIEFITDGGKLLKKEEGLAASLKVPSGIGYVRAKVTYSRIRGKSAEQFFAWSQPLFLSE